MNIQRDSAVVFESGSSTNIINYKIVIIGNQHVGKTTIISRYKYETTDGIYSPTVGIDFLTKNVFLEDKTIRLIMWDTAGQERFKSLIPSYLKNANCILIVYDVTDKSSFSSLNKWLIDVKDNALEGSFIILCGNKIDLNNKRIIPKEEGEKYAKENNISYFETSATTGEGINELFEHILSYASNESININCKYTNKESDLDAVSSHNIILKDLQKNSKVEPVQKKKNSCCAGKVKK